MRTLVSLQQANCVNEWIAIAGTVCMLMLKLLERSLCFVQVYGPNSSELYQQFVAKN